MRMKSYEAASKRSARWAQADHPMIKIFVGMIAANAFAGALIVAWVLFRTSIAIQAGNDSAVSPSTIKNTRLAFIAFEVILFGTFCSAPFCC